MQVQLLDGGCFTAPFALFHQGAPEGERFRFPVPAYLIEVGGERILVDTGLNPAAVADPGEFYEQPQVMGLFGFEQERSVAAQVDLEALTMVVLTHLHWDHVGGLPLIPPSVPVVIQRREWEAGQDPEAVARNFYMPRDYSGEERPLVLVDGDHDLLGDGSVELLFTPGHTPGHQSLRVGDLVIGADVVLFSSSLEDHRFPAFAADHEAQRRSAERLRELRDQGLTVMPGHDPAAIRPGPVPVEAG
jgi:glyoxylase-like metal-dependent hydrolase (beta-lactamase superfamily II)